MHHIKEIDSKAIILHMKIKFIRIRIVSESRVTNHNSLPITG